MDMMSVEADDVSSTLNSPFSRFSFCHTSVISQSYLPASLRQKKKRKKSAHHAEIYRGLSASEAVCGGG